MGNKKTAYNGRFGASGAVARPKVCANLQVYRPSERQWKPRLRQASGTNYAELNQKIEKFLQETNVKFENNDMRTSEIFELLKELLEHKRELEKPSNPYR